jgi:hypothetical protein
MINKKAMLFCVGAIVTNVVNVGAMDQQQRILEKIRLGWVEIFEPIVGISQSPTELKEKGLVEIALFRSPTELIGIMDDNQLSGMAAGILGDGDLSRGMELLASSPDLTCAGLREFAINFAREYERDNPDRFQSK